MSAHPSRGSWPHRELHRRSQRQGFACVLPAMSAQPSFRFILFKGVPIDRSVLSSGRPPSV
eukprot:9120248-Pyramimonas_sp.AAC.1